jgi:hypothetical protein
MESSVARRSRGDEDVKLDEARERVSAEGEG